MADIAGVPDVGLNAELGGDRLEGGRAGDRVGIGVILGEDRQPTLGRFKHIGELAGLILEFAGFEAAERGVGDHLRGVDDHIRAELAELVLADGIGGPDDDILVAVGLPDRRDRRFVGVDIGG